MELAAAAKYIGAGLACFGLAGAALALGNLFGQFFAGAFRNPAAADAQRGTLVLGFALTEALGIFSLLIARLLLFAV